MYPTRINLCAIVGCVFTGLIASAPVATGQGTVPLYSWYSPSRGDNFATTDPRWSGRPGATRSPDYRFVRIEGTLFDPGAPQPVGTVPVYSWYSPARGDNFLTSDPRWAGREGDVRDGYRFVRLEGYVHNAPRAGTVPLQSFWDPDRADNFATSDPRWIGNIDDRRQPNYRLYRTEGYVGPPSSPQPPDLTTLIGFGARRVAGVRPLLVVLTDYPDIRVNRTTDYFDSLVFGPSYPNIKDYFAAASGNRFTWSKAAILRVRFDEPFDTATANAAEFDKAVTRMAAASFDFARYDRNGDGTVADDELGLLVVNPVRSGSGASGQTRRRTVSADGKRIDGNVSYTHENGDIILYAHELFHQIGFPDHIYGPRASLNRRVSFFSGNSSAATPLTPMQLDPWYRIATGWLRPRVYPITRAPNSASIDAAEPLSSSSQTAIVLYDPVRGFDELFILEYRTSRGPNTRDGGYDAGVPWQGIAVWYVKRKNGADLVGFNWPPPFSRPYTGRGAHMYANYVLGIDGPGNGPFVRPEHGEFVLTWGDGTDSGIRIRVGPLASVTGTATLQWRHKDYQFAPRIDRVVPAVVRASMALNLTIEGQFPAVTEGVSVHLVDRGRRIRLAVETVSPTRLRARSTSTVPAGSYVVIVTGGSGSGSSSNGFSLRVAP